MTACALVFAAIGIAGGAARKPTFTAASTLQVGKVNINSPGFYGFVQSASDLATAFSRAITAAPVLRKVSHRLGLGAAAAAASLSAEPIPNSPAFRVIAQGPTARAAIALANVTSSALIAYEARANSYDPETQHLLDEYRAVSLTVARASVRASKASSEYALKHDAKDRAKLERAQALRATATLQAQALASSYQQSAQSASTTGLVSLLAGATTAASDRKSKIELLGFIGLLGGLVIGCAVAALYEQRRAPGRSGGGDADP